MSPWSLFIYVLLFAAAASAQSNGQSRTQLKKPLTEQQDLDYEITNPKLRTDSGAKKKLSMSINLNYSGSSLENPFANERPNLTGNVLAPETNINGRLRARYRFNKRTSVAMGVGYRINQPFAKPDEERGQDDWLDSDKMYVSNPDVRLFYSKKMSEFQTHSSLGFLATTRRSARRVGSVGFINPSFSALYTLPQTALQLGVLLSLSWTYFGSNRNSTDANVISQQEQWWIGVLPFIEYRFNDTYNLRTQFRNNNYGKLLASGSEFRQRPRTQSLGLGISVTRDIYVFPNIQWGWDNIDESFGDLMSKYTTFGLSTTFNL